MRKKRYFYAHSLIGGEGFEYRGDPVAILRGRVIAVVIFVLYGAAGHLSVPLQIVLGLVFAIAFPWLLVRSLAFNARNTAYRNIRFHFDGQYLDALKLFALCAALVLVTLGLAYPYAQARLTVNARAAGALSGVLLMSFGMIAFYLVGFAYMRTRIANAIWNHLAIGATAAGSPQVRFESRLRARDFAGLYLVNILAIVFTLGLATPWAVVRTMRYRARKTAVVVAGGLDQFVAARAADVDASGEEVGEMFGLDFSL